MLPAKAMANKTKLKRTLGVFVRMSVFILICIIVAFAAYVRFAPLAAERWHISISATEDKDMKGGAIRIVPSKSDTMAMLDSALKKLPRTSLLAGSATQGHVTYVTRSKWMGFPDYTTLEQSGDTIKMFARLRFGRQDLGVNAARLRKLVTALD
jgi:uncharacterized protein (DUF1499 family)